MKKKVVAFLLMCTMIFTVVGCSSAEIGYLELSKEVAQMEGLKVEETVVIELGEEFAALTGLDVSGYMEIQADGVMNEKKMAYDLNLSYRTDKNGEFQPLTRLIMDKDTIVMSTEGLWKWLIAFGYGLDGENFSPELTKEMAAYVAEHPYMKLSMAENSAVPKEMYEDLMAQSIKLLDTITAYHEGYSTNLVTEKDGGYAIHVAADDLLELVDGWLTYAQKDTANSFALVQSLFAWMEEISGEELDVELTEADWQSALSEVQKDWQSLKNALADVTLNEADRYDAYTKMTGTKGSRVVTTSGTLCIAELGLNITTDARSTEQTVAITMPANTMTVEAYMAAIDNIVDRYTVVSGATMRPISEQVAMVESQVTIDGQPAVQQSQCDLKYIEQKYSIGAGDVPVILPTAQVAIDGMTATISLNGKRTVIEGVMSGNMLGGEELFIPVRELSNVGVTITYTAEPEVLTLTVQ